MINLRYHVVSITAVFLALGIGLTLGSSFLDRVTVDNLKDRLDTVQERVDATERENDALAGRVDAFEERDAALLAERPGRLLRGHLEAAPVLLLATDGTATELVSQAVSALSAAGADVAGTWWLTDSWALKDAAEGARLGRVLGVTATDEGRLRRTAALRISDLLTLAAQPAAGAIDPVTGQPVNSDSPVDVPPPTEPELLAGLVEAGFIRYEPLTGSEDARVLLPGASARYVMVSSVAPGTDREAVVTQILNAMVENGTAPIVAAQGLVEQPEAPKAASEDALRTTFVGPLREGELTRDRLTTIDDLDAPAGVAALVLAVEDLGRQRTGHYGVATGAVRLLPGADPET